MQPGEKKIFDLYPPRSCATEKIASSLQRAPHSASHKWRIFDALQNKIIFMHWKIDYNKLAQSSQCSLTESEFFWLPGSQTGAAPRFWRWGGPICFFEPRQKKIFWTPPHFLRTPPLLGGSFRKVGGGPKNHWKLLPVFKNYCSSDIKKCQNTLCS